MSAKLGGIIWQYYPNGGGELLTALALADHGWDDGTGIWPSIAHLAIKTQQSERTVQYQMRAMEARGWLLKVKSGGKGKGSTTTYRIPIERIPLGAVDRVQNLHPKDRVQTEALRVQPDVGKGATAIAPEPSVTILSTTTISKSAKGAKAPSAVSLCFQAYQTGIKAKYGADYPPSAKTNGQLANLVARVGAEQAPALVSYYLSRTDAWLVKRKHGLEFLCKEAERWCLDMQAAVGGNQEGPVTVARTALVYEDDKALELKEYPAGEPEQIARLVLHDWRTKIANTKPRYISVRQGRKVTRFSLTELQGRA